MTVITKAITEKKTGDNLEQPLVVVQVPTVNSKNDPEAQRPPKKDLAGHYLILQHHALRPSAMTTMCLFITAILVMSIGIIGGVYIYRQYGRAQMHRLRTGWYSIPYDGTSNKAQYTRDEIHQGLLADSDLFKSLPRATEQEALDLEQSLHNKMKSFFKERFEIDLENDNYEKIDVPDFSEGRQGRFIHDFNINKTGIIDIDGRCCFVMPLNRQRVLPPRNMYDLLSKMYNGYYEVNTEVVRETMRVQTPAISDLSTVGTYIARECQNLPTYMLEKVNTNGITKRSISEARVFRQFAGKTILELNIVY
ncbi:integral membrane protein 2A isoform X2 [Belonocnema kinseyi]|uniref:integral membrane protein 2A isoform X2 n=1 Tax=Belonocnema kinseyi TaxID=2817044 RepID=UPI00143DFDA1|nr:integral membrane protein 2A isoform X2 [Belonocnema kinseyi]